MADAKNAGAESSAGFSFFGLRRGAKAKATQAHLGEELSFYYNEELKMWVERGKENEAKAKSALPPPPVIPHGTAPTESTASQPQGQLRRTSSSSGSLSSRYVSTFTQPAAGGGGDSSLGVVPGLPPHLLPMSQGGDSDRPQPKVALFMPVQPAAGVAQPRPVEGGSTSRLSNDGRDARSRPASTEPVQQVHAVQWSRPHSDAASNGSAVALAGPPAPSFTSPVRARDAAAGIMLLDDEDAVAGHGGAGSARKASRPRSTADAGGMAHNTVQQPAAWEAAQQQQQQQPRILNFGGADVATSHSAPGASTLGGVSSSQSQYETAAALDVADTPHSRIDDDDVSSSASYTPRGVDDGMNGGGDAYSWTGQGNDATAWQTTNPDAAAVYTEQQQQQQPHDAASAGVVSRWGPAPEGWDQAAFDAACDAAAAQGWVLNERGEWVAAEWANTGDNSAAYGEGAPADTGVTADATAWGSSQAASTIDGGDAAVYAAQQSALPAPGAPASEDTLVVASAQDGQFGIDAMPPRDGIADAEEQSRLVASLRQDAAAAWAAHAQAQEEVNASAATCESLRADIQALNAETAQLAALVDTLTGERDSWMERAMQAEAAAQSVREVAYQEGRAAAGAEADESVSDLLILLGQESRRVEALREAMDTAGLDSASVLARLQKEEDDEILAAMDPAHHPGGGGGDSGGAGGGSDGLVNTGADDGGALLAPPPAAPVTAHRVAHHSTWHPAAAATPFGAPTVHDETEEDLLASLPPPGKGLPAPPPLMPATRMQPAAVPLMPVPAHAWPGNTAQQGR